jgi:SAM-dependent methyltransferase
MQRSFEPEILDGNDVPAAVANEAYRQLALIHRVTGDVAAVVRAVRRGTLPVRRVLDIGCANGASTAVIQRKLGVEVVGVDPNPPQNRDSGVRIVPGNAVHDPLPPADVAYSMHTAHHLSEDDVVALVRNVGRSCRRFILVDLIRHRLPLALFHLFIRPFAAPVVVADGLLSFRRAYTREELAALVARALAGTRGRFVQSTAPFYIRQVIEITYDGAPPVSR